MAGFFLLTAAWAFADPLLSGPDEPAHLIRAESPTVIYYAGSVNPNGLEISAARARWRCSPGVRLSR